MKLIELEPRLLKRIDDSVFKFEEVVWEDSDGFDFLCPACFIELGGRIGCHHIICWKPHVPQSTNPIPGRWEMIGTSFENLTLCAGSSSVALLSGCMAHFLIINGDITDLSYDTNWEWYKKKRKA